MSPFVETVRTEGLGDSTHVLIHDGLAVIVDPQRDYDRFESVLDQHSADLRFVLETHVHNDYVSGGRDLAKKHRAEVVMPAGAAPTFRHTPAFHQEDLHMGDLVIRPVHTPGHTPEHVSYVIVVDGVEVAVFSGGSLLVASAGRSDLLGTHRADSLARLQYRSVNRLAQLPDDTHLYPTHGAGSFCTTTGATNVTSTIGEEKATSPILSYADEDAFVAGQLSNLVPYPSYYPNMAPINLIGPPTPEFDVPHISDIPSDVTIVDARPKEDYAAGHIEGSIGVPLRDSFGTWVGWVTEFNTPLVLVVNPDQDVDDAVRQLVRIGYEDIRGVITELPDDLVTYEQVNLDSYLDAIEEGGQILDVRAPDEWHAGHIEGSSHRYVPDIADGGFNLDPTRPVWVACGTGLRATTAASLLLNQGFQPKVLVGAGVTDVLSEKSDLT